MEKCRNWFNDLSLFKKIVLIVFIIIFCTFLIFFLNLQFLIKQYEKELYQTSAQALNHASASIANEMERIESISDQIISDSIIQENLYQLNQNPNSNRRAVYKRDAYQALFPYTFSNQYIKSINMVLPDGSNICMGNSDDIKKFDSAALKQISGESKGRIRWVSAVEPGEDVCCLRMLRQLKFLGLNQLADLCLVVDIEALISDSLRNAGYSSDNAPFVLIQNGRRIYPAQPYYDETYSALLEEMESSKRTYTITSIGGEKKFIITGSLPVIGWNYLYFRDYNPIFHNIRLAKLQVIVFSILSCIVALVLMWMVFGRILRHLEFLVRKIRCFGNGTLLPEQIPSYNYEERHDEIGQLHRAFDEMTKSVKVLRDENYDKQLLLRDATIRMLQQQINPHFLYNTLDTINWMAQKYGADDISTMARSLGNLFRISITGQEELIPLAEELSFLDNYIQIQNIRFKDRLNFEMNIPNDISHIQIPKLCIQPLVENALKHSMEYSDQICRIRVTLQERDHDYQIQVANTGSQFEENLIWKIEHREITPQGSGVGLTNINSRLKLLYGDSYGLTFYNQEGMAVVMLTIPKERRSFHAETHDCR